MRLAYEYNHPVHALWWKEVCLLILLVHCVHWAASVPMFVARTANSEHLHTFPSNLAKKSDPLTRPLSKFPNRTRLQDERNPVSLHTFHIKSFHTYPVRYLHTIRSAILMPSRLFICSSWTHSSLSLLNVNFLFSPTVRCRSAQCSTVSTILQLLTCNSGVNSSRIHLACGCASAFYKSCLALHLITYVTSGPKYLTKWHNFNRNSSQM